MSDVRVIETPEAAQAFAAELQRPGRRRPTVVVSVGAGRVEPFIDPVRILAEVDPYVEVVQIANGDLTWAFSASMPPETQVFGDAARVYHLDQEWITRPRRSKLHIASGPTAGARMTDQLIDDSLADAMAHGLIGRSVAIGPARTLQGVVQRVDGRRALVKNREVRLGVVSVREELTVEGVSLDRVLQVGQQVSGTYVADENLLDVRAGLLAAATALAHVRLGEVLLARVVQVRPAQASVEIFPGQTCVIGVEQVTGNPLDRLQDLLSPGEVVRVRVLAVGPAWSITLLDVDDDEPLAAIPSLLPGGPAWIVESELLEPELLEESSAAPGPEPNLGPVSSPSADLPPEPSAEPSARSPRPSPLLLDPRRRDALGLQDRPDAVVPPPAVRGSASAQPSTHDTAAAKHMARTIDQLKAEIAARDAELRQAYRRVVDLENELDRHQVDLRRLRTGSRRASQRAEVAPSTGSAAFVDAESQFRHAVYLAWVERIPAAEKPARPLPGEYRFSEHFFDTLAAMPPAVQRKAPQVAVEVLTGLADRLDGRETHPLRSGDGGTTAPRTRHGGAEICMRTAVQRETPGAARMHWWRGGDVIELSSVRHHDDLQP